MALLMMSTILCTNGFTGSVKASASSTTIFEESINGATAWSITSVKLYKSTKGTDYYVELPAKQKVKITTSNETSGKWWSVRTTVDGTTYNGYVEWKYFLINLPDVETSIIYNITNASSSIYKSSGYNLPGVTGENLYDFNGSFYRASSYRNRKICPVTYSMAKKIAVAEKAALADGYCLKIYDSFRPYRVTTKISTALTNLSNSNTTVYKGTHYSKGASGATYTWSDAWFLSAKVSKHNTGSAIDVTLCQKVVKNGKTTWKECTMPSKIHTLDTTSIKYYSSSCKKEAKNYSKGVLANTYAQKLDKYMTDAGLDTLASEWWHFQDLDSYNTLYNLPIITTY
jgi:D-alanyl-D-alanine dipeptidase